MDKIHKGLITNHTAYVYEDVCRERMWELNVVETWPFQFSKIGRWWDAHDEIDIAAMDPTVRTSFSASANFGRSRWGSVSSKPWKTSLSV